MSIQGITLGHLDVLATVHQAVTMPGASSYDNLRKTYKGPLGEVLTHISGDPELRGAHLVLMGFAGGSPQLALPIVALAARDVLQRVALVEK